MNFSANPTIYFVLKCYILVIEYAGQLDRVIKEEQTGVPGAHNLPQEE